MKDEPRSHHATRNIPSITGQMLHDSIPTRDPESSASYRENRCGGYQAFQDIGNRDDAYWAESIILILKMETVWGRTDGECDFTQGHNMSHLKL